MNKIIILGCGTSTGVPILGCDCSVCKSQDSRNIRTRSSVLIQTHHHKNILIDTTPDLRTQLLREKINHIESVIITHDHADHTHGIDDLRTFTFKSDAHIPVFSDSSTRESLTKKFPYIFNTASHFQNKKILGGGIPKLVLNEVHSNSKLIESDEFHFLSLPHGHTKTLGIVHSKMAYLTDCEFIPEESLNFLQSRNLELLIIDCLRFHPHETHLHFEKSLEYIRLIRPRLSVLTHMGHEFDYVKITEKIVKGNTPNVMLGYDGLRLFYS